MGIEFQDATVTFSGMVYEDEVVALRDYLQEKAPEAVVFDMSGCEDIHLAVVQVILAYVKTYDGELLYPEESRLFQKVCEGFERGDQHCV